jgi:integrase
MPRVATKLTPTKSGGFFARKRIPPDVQAAYQRLYGVRWEERLNTGPVPVHLARAKHREWLTDIETHIANIRAERDGSGGVLSRQQARALAGEWYLWFTTQQLAKARSVEHWEDYLSEVCDQIRDTVFSVEGDKENVDDIWERSAGARKHVRPLLADWGETSQFLAARGIALDQTSRDLFLDWLYRDFAAALRLLIKRAKGDYSPDERPSQFPVLPVTPDPSLTPWALFERWVGETKPATSTVDRWRGVFLKLKVDFSNQGASSLTAEQAHSWLASLVNAERSAGTVRDVWRVAARTVWSWAVDRKLCTANPFGDIRIPVPRKKYTRETKAFLPAEATMILSATMDVAETGRKSAAVKRWIPWICAYTGARSGEIAQLRSCDIIDREGIRAIRITPDAGTVKTGRTRVVPIHEHLIAQGFLEFVQRNGRGPLFYNEGSLPPNAAELTNPRKPRYVKARENLASWVRSIGIDDPELQPNHAWRHTFKQVAERNGISERISDAITGHAPATIARGYGAPTPADMAKALERFPRYEVGTGAQAVTESSLTQPT